MRESGAMIHEAQHMLIVIYKKRFNQKQLLGQN